MVEWNWKIILPDWSRVIACWNNTNLTIFYFIFRFEWNNGPITPSSRKKDTTRNEHETNYHQKIYSSKESHTTFKAKDALHKGLSRANAAPSTQTELEEIRRKDREWQQKCREMKKKQTSTNSMVIAEQKLKMLFAGSNNNFLWSSNKRHQRTKKQKRSNSTSTPKRHLQVVMMFFFFF